MIFGLCDLHKQRARMEEEGCCLAYASGYHFRPFQGAIGWFEVVYGVMAVVDPA